MNNLEETINTIFKEKIIKIIMSDLSNKNFKYHKIKIDYNGKIYQVSQYSDNQVFHKNIDPKDINIFILDNMKNYKKLNAWDNNFEYNIKITKAGKVLASKIKNLNSQPNLKETHNREKIIS